MKRIISFLNECITRVLAIVLVIVGVVIKIRYSSLKVFDGMDILLIAMLILATVLAFLSCSDIKNYIVNAFKSFFEDEEE